MLEIENLHAFYGLSHVLQGVSLGVEAGEIVSILGRNGAGKTTTLLTIMGYLKPRPGEIRFKGRPIGGLSPYRISRTGVGFVPQERGIFSSLTVRENLTVAARKGFSGEWTLKRIYGLFPRLEERAEFRGMKLSGGEQQMLAIARALMLNPELLILDEPSEGLAPLIVKEIISILQSVRSSGVSILLVEQNVHVALSVADRHYVMSKGAVCYTGSTEILRNRPDILNNHIGI